MKKQEAIEQLNLLESMEELLEQYQELTEEMLSALEQTSQSNK